MTSNSLIAQSDQAISIHAVYEQDFEQWLNGQPQNIKNWLDDTGFKSKPGAFTWLPGFPGGFSGTPTGSSGTPTELMVIIASDKALENLGHLPKKLPQGDYRLVGDFDPTTFHALALGWGLGSYRFDRYQNRDKAEKQPGSRAKLIVPEACNEKYLRDQLDAISLTRDLINTPASDMLPTQLAAEARALAETFGADLELTIGDELLARNLHTIHCVGRASADAPRLIDITWGEENHPLITLVGKGVCFDSGGLDLKAAKGMRLMKKDMGGSAHALGLAHLIMAQHLPVRLRVLIPAVENAVAGNAYRPGDILTTYKGLTVEVDNTDAEGRLVLCDALALACEDKPQLIVDFATLTGAARVALGAELPAMFCNDDEVAEGLFAAAAAVDDPVWRLPLHQNYRPLLKSHFADLVNSASGGLGGAITAGLFLESFIDKDISWVHFDVMAWNLSTKPAHPKGGEAMALRAVYHYLQNRYSNAA